MAIKSLDLSKVEQGIGIGILEPVSGNPFLGVPTREAVPVALTQRGNADGYEMTTATAFRVYADLVLGAATFVDIFFKAQASNPKGGGVPDPAASPDFEARLPQFDDVLGKIVPVPNTVRLIADGRICMTIPRPSQLFKIFVQSDNVAAQLGLGIQSVLAGGE